MTEEDLKPGVILVDKDGCQHKVFKKIGNLWLLSKRNDFRSWGHRWTLEEINQHNNKIYDQHN